MAFQFDPNQSPIDGAAAVAQLVAVLVTAGWAIHAYGDGAARTAGGVGFSATSLRDNSGAWVAVLEPAGGPGTLVFQRSAAGAGDNTSWWVAYAHDGLNADGNGNTVDTEFTAGDLKDVLGSIGDTHGSGAAALFPADDALGCMRCSVGADDATRNWYLVGWNKGTGEARTLLFCDVVTGHASDTDLRVIHASRRDFGPWAGEADVLTTYGTAPFSWFKRGLGGATWERCYPMSIYSVNGGRVVPMSAGLNPFDGNDDLFVPVYFHDRAAVRYFKGTSSLLMYCAAARSTAHTFDPTGAGDDRVCFGHIALPWPAGTAALV